jgi:hypothetical protein
MLNYQTKEVISMLNKIKNAYLWLVSQLKAGISWLRDTWPPIQAKAEKIAHPVYKVAVSHVRKVIVCFNGGVVTAIETAERRQMMPFHQAFNEARAVVKTMTDEQVSNYAAYWFRREEACAVAA